MNCIFALAVRLQLDLFCRIGNIVGDYALRMHCFLNEDGTTCFDDPKNLTKVKLRGSKTSHSFSERILVIRDGSLKQDLLKFLKFQKVQKQLTKTDVVFPFTQIEFNKFLQSNVSTTSHGLRSLGARIFAEDHTVQETMKRGGWKSYSSYKRYVCD